MADLITLNDYKLAQGLTDLKNDDRIESLITSVSQLVKTYCATTFVDYYATPKTEVFNITYETNIIQLNESPILSVTSVEERNSYSSAYVTITEAAFEFYIDTTTDSLFRTGSRGYGTWPMGPGAVKVVYMGGYTEVPSDLKLAVLDLVKYYYKEEYKERRSIGTASMSNKTTSSQDRNVGFPDHIKRILDLYKQLYV